MIPSARLKVPPVAIIILHLTIVLCYEILKSGDRQTDVRTYGRTNDMCENNEPCRLYCGSTEWIKNK